ncbi:class I SAM-dependent methyltransferase [Streptomyces chiangmaiensis]
MGAGNGLNFAHYPPQVTRVLAVEPDPHLGELARQAARSAPVPVEVVDGMAEEMPTDDASFGTAVACLTLCSVTDPDAALLEMHRVLWPGGRLHFYEHVRAEPPSSTDFSALLTPPSGPACSAAATAAGTRRPRSHERDSPWNRSTGSEHRTYLSLCRRRRTSSVRRSGSTAEARPRDHRARRSLSPALGRVWVIRQSRRGSSPSSKG